MFANILELLKSKKFKVMAFSVAALVSSGFAEQITWSEVTSKSIMIIMTYIAAQGLADIGKAISSKSESTTTAPEEKK